MLSLKITCVLINPKKKLNMSLDEQRLGRTIYLYTDIQMFACVCVCVQCTRYTFGRSVGRQVDSFILINIRNVFIEKCVTIELFTIGFNYYLQTLMECHLQFFRTVMECEFFRQQNSELFFESKAYAIKIFHSSTLQLSIGFSSHFFAFPISF